MSPHDHIAEGGDEDGGEAAPASAFLVCEARGGRGLADDSGEDDDGRGEVLAGTG